jgi:molybdopterin-guanine dinucleotide biosynthesis protein A
VDVPRTDLSAVVVAGGASRRFGSDKLREELAGRSVLGRVLDAVVVVTPEVAVVGPWAPDGWRRTSEPDPGQGPLGALAHGLTGAGSPWVVVVGGDHPLVRPQLLGLVVERARSSSALAVVPVHAGRDQPLVACYRRDVGAVAADLVAGGERRLLALLDAVTTVRLDEQDWRPADPEGRSFLDVDTPADLQRVKGLLER